MDRFKDTGSQHCLIQLCLLLSCVQYIHPCDQTKMFISKSRLCCELCEPGYFAESECSALKKTVCSPCPSNTFSAVPDHMPCKTCTICTQVTSRPCNSTADAICSCLAGFVCTNKECSQCQVEPKCGRGEQLKKSGQFEFYYSCEQCPNNTYSDTTGGTCKPLAQCEQMGLKLISPGNRTHNTQCGCFRNETHTPQVTAVHLSMILLLLLILQLCSCCIGRHCKYNKQITSMMPTTGRADRKCRCPLSEEEKGDPDQVIDHKVNSNYELSSFEQKQKSML
ncbi:tumor necrosis factor receptor superfamily member 18 [Arapaima gigas]